MKHLFLIFLTMIGGICARSLWLSETSVFATEGCTCSVDACENWSYNGPPQSDCDNGVWQDCTEVDDTRTVSCAPTGTQTSPDTTFVYEIQTAGGFCENNNRHLNNSNDTQVWERRLTVCDNGDPGSSVRLKFSPDVSIDLLGMTDANVCPESSSTGEIKICHEVFAELDYCSQTSSAGWSSVTHIFKKVSGVWKLSGGSTDDPATVDLGTIQVDCACTASANSAKETVKFRVQVEKNSGVKFGEADAPMKVNYRLSKDETQCEIVST